VKISRLETHLAPEQAVVRAFTDDGLEGLGQTACHGAAITTEVLHTLVAPHFLGRDPWDLQALVRACLHKTYKFRGTFLLRALCGVETALWDLLGKATGRPVHQLLGGAVRHEIPMYASSLTRDTTPEEEAQSLAAAVAAHGFRGVKIKVGGRMGADVDASPGRTERLIPLMRETLGRDVAISADANGGFSTHRAIRVGRMLEEHGYFHFEEPCPYYEYPNTKRVADALDIPVAGGEQDNDLGRFREMIGTRTVDVVQCDVGYIGGLTRARRVAEMAELAGIPCTPHCSNPSMLQVFTLHLAAAMPACSHPQEWRATNPQPWATEIYEPRLEVKGGVVKVPEGPGSGWGVRINPSYLKGAETRVSKL